MQERREQQYLERLRGAAVPAASDDLTARLLARTEGLARDAAPAAPLPGGELPSTDHGARGHGARGRGARQRGARPGIRLAALAAGGATAAVALMAGSAYLMGGTPVPPEAAGTASAFLHEDMRVSSAAGAGTGWSLTGEPDITPSDALTAGQLAALRAQGWSCPELRELGFHLVWARGGVVAGTDMVELRLTDGRYFATVLEQHSAAPPQRGSSGVQPPAATPPVNVLTGHTATADGFTAVSAQSMGAPAGTGPETFAAARSGRLWINPAAPFRAIYQNSAGTYTYVSDQPAALAGEGVAALVAARAVPRPEAAPADGTTPDGITARIERGMGRILKLLAP
ncbi:hypothetical protein [Arthrobacter sp. UYCu712]|uniref:hypothetical protein n=1 Tax=Arthrobacter sp. UYCu712 TaxID=3156340 RepID=UPI00339B8E7E